MTISEKERVVCNFHVHTNYSFDGYNSFRKLYKFSRKANLDVIAITDHDTIDGALDFSTWLRKNGKEDLQVIIGEEVTCSDGTHIIGLNIVQHIPGDTPLTVVEAIKKQGGFVYFPHPTRHDGILSSAYKDACLPLGDFYEAFNGKAPHDFNLQAMDFFAQFPDILPLAGSDAHYNCDLLKCTCVLPYSSKNLLSEYKSHKKICINGYPKKNSAGYFPTYYKFKSILNPPGFIKSLGKAVFPAYKNFKERNLVFKLEKVYDNL
ncbi:PHP domain-containing protein [Pontibacter sp. JH31]|uniref:PHP domain-containing protein n=1 Tax=Pontibacter aquaedesilientis TaxID=2766980 RepID=A0ABR7XH62_9BACT|nr:PHP domain-containing protein [Pontibacter aquaedesilientis]MBD1397610.1 PHP domain-containing protein [Pontibacter aquaedesilientis]